MQNILYISNIARKVGTFSMATLKASQNIEAKVFFLANWEISESDRLKEEDKWGIKILQAPIPRSPFKLVNFFKSLLITCRIIKEYKITCIHCNTPTGGLLGRIAGYITGCNKILYQVHGFHFYKGCPVFKGFFYYNIERLLAKLTDAIITINSEDYEAAKKFRLRNEGSVFFIPGVGIDLSKYVNSSSKINTGLREILGINKSAIVLLSTGDLISRKNYEVAIKAISSIRYHNIIYLICGEGPERYKLEELVSNLNLGDKIKFLGRRNDIIDLLSITDIFLFTSKQEGLSRSVMEAMASGKACVVSNIRGNVDLIKDQKGGYLCDCMNCKSFANALEILMVDEKARYFMGQFNRKEVEKYSIDKISSEMTHIYKKFLYESDL